MLSIVILLNVFVNVLVVVVMLLDSRKTKKNTVNYRVNNVGNYIITSDKPAVKAPEGYEVTHVEYVRDSERNWVVKSVEYKKRHNYINDNPFAVNKPEGYEVTSAEFVRDSKGNWTTKNVKLNRRH